MDNTILVLGVSGAGKSILIRKVSGFFGCCGVKVRVFSFLPISLLYSLDSYAGKPRYY